VIVADTGAIVALIDRDDKHHEVMIDLWEQDSDWILPWAILPEVDYLLARHVGQDAALSFLEDLANGAYAIEWNEHGDLARAEELCARHAALELGLVDATVMAVAERLRAQFIATLDLRDFGAVRIKGSPRLLPRDR
jgi:predicted nucleic acid-binding protein